MYWQLYQNHNQSAQLIPNAQVIKLVQINVVKILVLYPVHADLMHNVEHANIGQHVCVQMVGEAILKYNVTNVSSHPFQNIICTNFISPFQPNANLIVTVLMIRHVLMKTV